MSILERDIERTVSKYALDHKFLSYKFVSPNNKGVPDRVFVSPQGQIIFIEFKQKGKYLTKLQYFIFNKLSERGCKVYMVRDVLEGIAIIDKYLNKESI